MQRALHACPSCGGTLAVAELSCEPCAVQVRGQFIRCRFCQLSPEHAGFLEMFLRNRGNLTGVSAELGVSHPTAAKRLDGLLNALEMLTQAGTVQVGVPMPTQGSPDLRVAEKQLILTMLDRGEISAEEAVRRLRDLA